jgi:signal transduction histidine kinase
VRAYLEVLLSGDLGTLNDRQMEALGDSHGALVRMYETVETFLDVAKIQMGKLELFMSESDLGELAGRVVAEMGPLAEKKGVSLVLESRPGAYVLDFDSGKIYHVLLNLIDNAIKYTEKGKIAVRLSREKDSVVVRVKDTGIGMSDADIRLLFTQFSRGAEGIRLDPSGSGLGLFLARKIVEAHGGRILVDSPGKGRGSMVGFRLPVATHHT